MEFEPKRKPKAIMAGTRFTEDEYKLVKAVASRYQRTIGETIRTLTLKAIVDLRTKTPKVPKR